MNKPVLYFLLFLILNSCSTKVEEDVDLEIAGKWKLVANLVDPGDGSGEFEAVDSNRIIEFFETGTYRINGPSCTPALETGEATTGIFNSTEETLLPNKDCGYEEFKLIYEFRDSNLIIWWPCIEGCGQKFEKISSN